VELAGALGEIANDTLKLDFRSIRPSDARIELVEAMDRVLPTYPPGQSASARRQLERLGVMVRTGTRVTAIRDGEVVVEPANAPAGSPPAGSAPAGSAPAPEIIRARTVLWAAGVQASTFARTVAESVGAETDRSGRIRVGADLTVPGHPEILVGGDAAIQPWTKGRQVPGVAQGGIQGGKHAARVVLARLDGRPAPAFRFQDRGDVAVIGRLRGVTNIGWLGPLGRQSGFIAWALWLGIHIVYLIGFANRIVVSVRWAWSFLTRGRSTRLITGSPLIPPIEDPGGAEPPA
jgi:NADH dehydrogenase